MQYAYFRHCSLAFQLHASEDLLVSYTFNKAHRQMEKQHRKEVRPRSIFPPHPIMYQCALTVIATKLVKI